MRREIGKIIAISNDYIIIEFQPHEGCCSCPSNTFCNTKGPKQIKIKNTISAKKGDIVEFEMNELADVASATILYGMPVLFLILGMLIGYNFFVDYNYDHDAAMALGGLGGFFVSFVIIKALNKFFEKSRIFNVYAIRVRNINIKE